MSRNCIRTLLALFCFLAAGATMIASEANAARRAPMVECNRKCLEDILAKYVNALVRHDPTLAPFSKDVRFTENNVEMAIGDGLWGTINAKRDSDLIFADTQNGQVAWFGAVEEHGIAAYIALRLKVRNGEISEVETIVRRNGDWQPPLPPGIPPVFPDASTLTHEPFLSSPIPKSERLSREELIAAANGYWDTLQRNNGQIHTKFAPDCMRKENGGIAVGAPADSKLPAMFKLSCEAQFKLGMFIFDDRLRDRRFDVVDVERGLVLSSAIMDHSGRIKEYKFTDGTPRVSPFLSPNSFVMLEHFKVDRTGIRRINAVFVIAPYNMPSAWKSE